MIIVMSLPNLSQLHKQYNHRHLGDDYHNQFQSVRIQCTAVVPILVPNAQFSSRTEPEACQYLYCSCFHHRLDSTALAAACQFVILWACQLSSLRILELASPYLKSFLLPASLLSPSQTQPHRLLLLASYRPSTLPSLSPGQGFMSQGAWSRIKIKDQYKGSGSWIVHMAYHLYILLKYWQFYFEQQG